MKTDVNLFNNLKSIRTRLDLSQQDLANIVGVTRQTIGSLESGQYAPSISMCLRLAKALACKVEDLFWLDEDFPEIEASIAGSVVPEQSSQVTLAKVGEQWIAYPLVGNDAFRIEMIPSDGEIVTAKKFTNITELPLSSEIAVAQGLVKSSNIYSQEEAQRHFKNNKVSVRLLDDIDRLQNTVVIAACTPVLSVLAKATERWHPKLRVHYRFAHSRKALRSLCQGEVHIAGMHLYDPKSREHNIPFAREALAGRNAILITLGVWQEGLLVPPGNPMGVKTVADLVEFGATIITHEAGSAGRTLLERKLQEQRVPFQSVKQFDRIAHNHQEVAFSVASGMVDAGISNASIAAAFGLGFIPLHQARYDLVILKEYLEQAPVQQFINILGHRAVRSQLEVLGGYDTSNIGEVIANV
ncbi:helix-turn-helix domain-containing protein [Nostoc sp. FACHB-87]|uniref:substrate-binding domain-containing protein n=1 Tax=Nostocaceae TaxID=1162 RepID=UPI0016871CBA|nr:MULTISPECIES: substrate-binding domain-containing protein [Nostocaceae]MBD2458197.1 helix-turn-helix domain-containing protein [Nostoc sp. FACHB-87]MBD2480043.1 helix-turn-helix domain-containing protein [Anabaena sp. FACHB-83]